MIKECFLGMIDEAVKHGTKDIYWNKGNTEVKREIVGKLNDLLPLDVLDEEWDEIVEYAWIKAGVHR